MTNDEGPGEILENSFRFAASNVKSLAIWGIAFTLAIIVMMVVLFAGILLFHDDIIVMLVLMLLSYIPVIAVTVLLMGFVCQCLKTVLGGGRVMPTGLESPGDLVKDGIVISIILLEAVVLIIVLFLPIYAFMILAGPGNIALMLAAMGLMLLAIPVTMLIYFVNVIQWAVYADTGSLLQGLNPLKAIGLIASNWRGAAVTALLLFAASIVFSIIMFVCEIFIVTILLLPFLMVAMYPCMAYIIAVFYRQSRGDRPNDIRDAVTGGYSVT
ncbi:MAG: DUF4013 domain-containing protein [Methanocella sp.]